MFDKVRTMNKKKFSNYVEIFIKTDLNKIISSKKEKFIPEKNEEYMGSRFKAAVSQKT